ncbi:MAG: Nif11-like leader peptide family RiPP precursor [Oscillospiraceae bacterium]
MTTQDFINKMAEDEALSKKLSECKSPEEAYETAKAAGLTDDFESFKAVMTAVNKRVNGELSDDELEAVAGGTCSPEFQRKYALGGITVAVALGTAAAL